MNRFARILSAAGLALGLALAGVPTGAAQPSPAAKEILAIKHASNEYANAVPSMVARVRDLIFHDHLDYRQDLNEVAVILDKELAGREREIGDEWATNYAAVFTEQELKDLVIFYKSPLGQKLLSGEPQVIQRNIVSENQWAQAFAETVTTQFRIEMHKRGKDL